MSLVWLGVITLIDIEIRTKHKCGRASWKTNLEFYSDGNSRWSVIFSSMVLSLNFISHV